MRRLIATAVLLLLSLALPAGLAAGNVSISIWYSTPEGPGTETFLEAIEEFSRLHPDIEVEATNQGGYGPNRDKAVAAYAGGAAPNVVMFALVNTLQFVDVGALLPLNGYLERDDMLDDIFPQMIQAATYGNKIYGLPFNSSTAVQYRNLDLFRARGLGDQAPSTWTELEAALTRLTHDRDGDGNPDIFGGFYQHNWNFLFDQWIFQNGGSILNEAGNAFAFNSPAAVGAMEFLQDLVHVKHVAATGTGGSGNTRFLAGEVALKRASTAQLGRFISDAEFELGVAPMSCNVTCWASISGGNLTMMKTGTVEEQDASWELIKHIYSTENLARYSVASGYMASRRSSFESEILQTQFDQDPRYRASYMQVDYGAPRDGTFVPFWPLVQDEIRAVGSVMFRDNGNVKEALDNAVEVSNARLREYLQTSGRDSLYDW